jgi:hypothetical protein
MTPVDTPFALVIPIFPFQRPEAKHAVALVEEKYT